MRAGRKALHSARGTDSGAGNTDLANISKPSALRKPLDKSQAIPRNCRQQIESAAACPLLGTAGTAAGKGGLWSIGKEDVMLGLFVKLPKNTGERTAAGATLAVNKAAALRHGGTLATMAANLTQAIDATSTQGKKGQCSNAAKLLCDASATDFDALVAGARAEAAAAAQQANEELAASEGPHDTEETGAEDQKTHRRGGGTQSKQQRKAHRQGRTTATKHTKTQTARHLGPTRNPPRAA
ncbi:hypothetical protein ERJ75_001509000 [Trypanosoma vivax]|nr:hypothetical protein ERJ75_001509000 [Trypanosoma vivax]